jgi:two-component sensor histidine kinase
MRDITSRLEFVYVDVPALRPGTIGAYLLAIVSVGVATALRLAIGPYVEGLQFATFLPAVIITALVGGLGAGLFSVVLCDAAIAFFVLPPRLSLYVEKPGDVLSLLLYTVVMLFNVAIITGMRHAVERRRDQEALNTQRKLRDEERNQQMEKERLLMREVNHRAKNMLCVVEAIAHQTAAKNPEDFAVRFSDRIKALSANQDLLVRNQWQGVRIKELVRAQCAPFADLIGTRKLLIGPRLRVNACAAQAIGLAFHELSTNSGKYGALSTDTGRVDIRWGTEGETFTISWTERDGPPVSPPQRRGFGSTVMKEMAERSLDGRVELDYAPTGVTWRLTCPAANALEAREGA